MIKFGIMKKYILSIIAIAFGILSAFAQTVSVSDVTLNPGETKVVSINLNNSQTNIVSFQIDLTLPEGITINKACCSLGSRITDNDQGLTIGKQPDGSIRLISTSFALNPITGTSGEIVKLSLTAANDAKGGTASLKNIVLATSSSQELIPADVSFNVNVYYTLTYKVDGEIFKTLSVACGTAITPEDAPKKEGYTFSEWSGLPKTMPNHDVTVIANFTINKYKLTYKVDDKEYKSYEIYYGTTLTPEAYPVKEGHTFSGWSNIPETMPAKDVIVTGAFIVNYYTLTYMVEGKEYKKKTVAYGTSITPETGPQKEGYTFSGWSGLPKTMPAHDVEVTATFSINSYTLTYKVDGEVYKTSSVVYGTALTLEAEPTKEGYTFSGWSEIPTTMPAHDVTVQGSFTINKYKLTYIVDGMEYKSYEINYASTITLEAFPVKEGHTFSGWSEIPQTMPAKDVTIIGSFTINSYTLTYKVDGEIYKTSTVVYGTELTPVTEPTKKGYTFSGWSEIPETMPAHDVEVSGSFVINKYKLTYEVNGEVYREYFVEYNSEIIPESAPEEEGYAFSGWSWIPKKMPAEDVIVKGTLIPIKYKLTYMVDGEVYKTYEVAFNSEIIPEPDPQKEGYTFSGWSWIPKEMVAEDVIVTGSFTVNSYTITYVLDGEVYKTETLEYGTKIVPPIIPNLEDYSIWEDVPATMPACDITIYGKAKDIIDGLGLINNGQVSIDNSNSVYDLLGRKINSSLKRKGINIIRYSDGTTRKVMIK